MRYVLKNWEGLIRYLEDSRLSIDNNHTEREIKPFVIARKNFMFAQSQAGARAMALHFSLIRTAKLHGLDPYRYYVQIMEKMPHCETVEDFEKLLPWHINMNKVVAESEHWRCYATPAEGRADCFSSVEGCWLANDTDSFNASNL